MNSQEQDYVVKIGSSYFIATAIHNGHNVRAELKNNMKLSEADRLREEDPYTGKLTSIADNTIILNTSRFEVDLNRDRAKAIYAKPEDAWGLDIWNQELPEEVLKRSYEKYDQFYLQLHSILSELEKKHGMFLVYDIHSYNHRRNGQNAPDEDPEKNPEVNLGTGSVNEKWNVAIDRFVQSLSDFDYYGRSLDVRCNIKFKGGHMSRWIHKNFPENGLCLSIEFKKFFMDEWTGKYNEDAIKTLNSALQSTVDPVKEAMQSI